jgi:hypothetical protein
LRHEKGRNSVGSGAVARAQVFCRFLVRLIDRALRISTVGR